jgi:hypothetical protein
MASGNPGAEARGQTAGKRLRRGWAWRYHAKNVFPNFFSPEKKLFCFVWKSISAMNY